jgi:hypothetical protein
MNESVESDAFVIPAASAAPSPDGRLGLNHTLVLCSVS